MDSRPDSKNRFRIEPLEERIAPASFFHHHQFQSHPFNQSQSQEQSFSMGNGMFQSQMAGPDSK